LWAGFDALAFALAGARAGLTDFDFTGAAARRAAGFAAGDFFAGAFLACLCAVLLKDGRLKRGVNKRAES
jgi:hypothetical protein